MTAWPQSQPTWLVPWTVWRLQGKTGPRPAKAPITVPAWAFSWLAWVVWRRYGATPGKRPAGAPVSIPAWAWTDLAAVNKQVPIATAPAPSTPVVAAVTGQRTWVECHAYYDPAQAQLGRMLDDAQRWHQWPNCVPMIGLGNGWTISSYPELAGRSPWSMWRWETVPAGSSDWDDAAHFPGCYVWTADGFEAGTGTVDDLIGVCKRARAVGVFLQAGHATAAHADALRGADLDVQAWASCEQIHQDSLREALAELRPSRFVAQIESPGERSAMAAAVTMGVLGATPWDCVIAGWGDFEELAA